MDLELLQTGARQFGLELTAAQLAAFDAFARVLLDWNQRVNLTRITDPSAIVTKHFLDSLSVALALADLSPALSLIDVGSGAGFPGLPLKIALPQLRVTLLESTGKKTAFLQHAVAALKLEGVAVVTARAEEAGRQPQHRAQYDVAVARAVASVQVLAEYTLPLVKIGGLVVAQKGHNPAGEVRTAANALGILRGRVQQIVPVTVPTLDDQRHLIVIKKTKSTPMQYPRRPGLPAKKPI
jgi:16S rRNA (guanine527-N7)-methyltransferase